MNSSSEYESSFLWKTCFTTVSSLLAAFIVIGNCLVVAAFAASKSRAIRTATYKFLVSLAISDFFVGSVSMPLWIYLKHRENGPGEGANILQDLFKYLDIFSAMASIFHLVAICIERHIVISRPFKDIPAIFYHFTIAVAWIFALVLSLIWELEFVKFYAIVGFLVGFLAPMAVIIFVYGNILRTAWALIQRTPELRRRNRIREERKVVMTVFLVSNLFVLCWFPFFVTSIMAQFHLLPSKEEHRQLLIVLVKWLQYINSALNPIIYAFRDRGMIAGFRALSKRILPNFAGRCARNLDAQEEKGGFVLKARESPKRNPSNAQQLATQ